MEIFDKKDFPDTPTDKQARKLEIDARALKDAHAVRRDGYEKQMGLMERAENEKYQANEERLLREAINIINIRIEELVAFAAGKDRAIPDERVDDIGERMLRIIQEETKIRGIRGRQAWEYLSKELKSPKAGEKLLREIISRYFVG